MPELLSLLVLFAIGIPGWLAFNRLKLPGAPILGSMLAVGVFGIYGIGPGPLPAAFKAILQVVVGLFIGLRVSPDTRRQLRGMVPVAVLVSAWWLVTAFGVGLMLYGATPLDLKTALLGSTPGGISEMGLLALNFGADAPSVALLQFFRVTLVLIGVPVLGPKLYPLLERLSRRGTVARGQAAAVEHHSTVPEQRDTLGLAPVHAHDRPGPAAAPERSATGGIALYLRTFALAVAGGWMLEAVGFPSGGLVGSMLAVGAARLFGVRCANLPSDARAVAQVGLGGMIGMSFTAEMIRSFGTMIVPIVLLTGALLFNGFLLSVLVHRLTGWEPATCVLSTCAGGLTNISAVAEDLGGNPVHVTLLHVVRLISIVTVLPAAFAALFGM